MNMGISDAFWIALLVSIAFSAGRFFPVETVVERIVRERIELEEKNRSIVQSSRIAVLKSRGKDSMARHALN